MCDVAPPGNAGRSDALRGRKVALLRTGSFSHVNGHVLEMLEHHFPECEVVDIDVGLEVGARKAANLLATACEYGRNLLRGRAVPLGTAARRNPRYFREVRDYVRRRARTEQFAFTLQTQSLWDASTPGIPHFVYTDHTHLSNLRYPHFDRRDLRSERWIALERSIYEHAERVFVTSRFAERSLVEDYGCAPERVECVYSGVNVDVRAAAAQQPGNKTVLFVGTEWERKGGPQLVEAFRAARRVHPDAQLEIVGCTPDVTAPGCRVVGPVPRERLSGHYASAALFCLPSLVEPSAVALVEAAAHGLPVVATDVGGTADRVLHGRTGCLVPPGDVSQLASALIELLGDAALRRRLGEEGRRLAAERFTWPAVGAAMCGSIRRALERRGGSLRFSPVPS
ncbi:MAG TPA: glycosyltransferase family 4 protein [Gammaproteobacteria bacterium]